MNRRWIFISMICFLGVLHAVNAESSAFIDNASGARNDQVLSVSFKVVNAFTPDMEKTILSGIPQTFTYYFEIYREIEAWPDLRIYNWTVRRTIRYDTLKKTFSVDLGSNDPPKQTTELAEAKKWMTEFEGYPVGVVPSLDRSFKHYLRLKAQLDPVKWPLFLDKILFFPSLGDFETPWQRIDLPLQGEEKNGGKQ